MMQETVTRYYCDDCRQEIAKHCDSMHIGTHDLCPDCVYERLEFSINKCPIGRQCKYCKGTGKVKDFFENGEHNWIKCSACNGTKVVPVSSY